MKSSVANSALISRADDFVIEAKTTSPPAAGCTSPDFISFGDYAPLDTDALDHTAQAPPSPTFANADDLSDYESDQQLDDNTHTLRSPNFANVDDLPDYDSDEALDTELPASTAAFCATPSVDLPNYDSDGVLETELLAPAAPRYATPTVDLPDYESDATIDTQYPAPMEPFCTTSTLYTTPTPLAASSQGLAGLLPNEATRADFIDRRSVGTAPYNPYYPFLTSSTSVPGDVMEREDSVESDTTYASSLSTTYMRTPSESVSIKSEYENENHYSRSSSPSPITDRDSPREQDYWPVLQYGDEPAQLKRSIGRKRKSPDVEEGNDGPRPQTPKRQRLSHEPVVSAPPLPATPHRSLSPAAETVDDEPRVQITLAVEVLDGRKFEHVCARDDVQWTYVAMESWRKLVNLHLEQQDGDEGWVRLEEFLAIWKAGYEFARAR